MSAVSRTNGSAVGPQRYSGFAVAVHWLTAAMIVLTLLVALWLEQRTGAQRGALVRLHKSIGLTIFFVSFIRVFSLTVLRPPLALELKPWERRAAGLTHTALYVLLLLIPLTGWAMISADGGGRKTFWFGLLYWPKIRWLADLADPTRSRLHDFLGELHLALGLAILVLIVIHVAAVAKHERIDRYAQLRRMTWKGPA